MSIPTTPNFNFPLPPDGAGSANGETWGTQFRSMISALDSHLNNVVNQGTIGIDTPPTTPDPFDDEFNGPTIDSSWTVSDPDGVISLSNGSLEFSGVSGQLGVISKYITGNFKIMAKMTYAAPHTASSTGTSIKLSCAGTTFSFGFSGNSGGGLLALIIPLNGTPPNYSATGNALVSLSTLVYSTAYMSIENNGTNLIFQISPNGLNWVTLYVRPLDTPWVGQPIMVALDGQGSGGAGVPFLMFVDWIRRIS